MTEYSFSYSPSAPIQPAHTAPLWSFNGVEVFAGPEGTSVLYRKSNGMRAMVQNPVVAALMHCSSFKPLEQHAQVVTQRIPELQNQYEDALNTLQQIAQLGLMESAQEAFNRLAMGDDQSNGGAIDAFILTCDRPDALLRLLNSIADKPMPPKVHRLVVIDDSRSAQHTQSNAAICAQVSTKIECEVVYFGLEQRQELIDGLLRNCPEHKESIGFLLSRDSWPDAPTYGLARNLAQLLSVGRRAIVMDDDILCQAIAPPGAARGLKFGSIGDREAVLYSSREELNQHELALEQSPLALATPLIGASLAQALAQPGGLASPQALMDADGRQLNRFSGSSKALLTQTGTWGDSGTSQGSWLFFTNAKSLEKILSSKLPLHALLDAQSVWMGFRGATITPYGSMSQLTGLDNRELLPPYLPAHRGEDLLFSLMLQRVHPTSFVCNTPWAVPHLPLEPRKERGVLKPIQAGIDVPALAEWLGREPADQWGQPPERNLYRLSEELHSLASMDMNACSKLLGGQLAVRNTSLLTRCLKHLEAVQHMPTTPAAQEWLQFLSDCRNLLVEQSQGSANTGATLSNIAIEPAKLRQMGHQFADALIAWPEIREAARCLNL